MIPRGLKFNNRLAAYHGGYLFVCQRKGHAPIQKLLDLDLTDAKAFRAAHDTAYHNVMFAHLGFQPAKNIRIPDLCAEWKRHIEDLETAGARDAQTTRHYHYTCDYIVKGMKELRVRTVREIDPSVISMFVAWMKNNSGSHGSAIVKTLTALRTMIRWKGLPCDWVTPHDEIRAERTAKRDLDSEMIRKLIEAMPVGSQIEAIAYLKARTGARDVEIFKAKRDEFDLESAVFAPVLRSKGRGQRQRRHAYALTADVVEKIRPFVERASGYVFTKLDGSHVTRESLRAAIRAASRSAGVTKEKRDRTKKKPVRIGDIDSIAQIRAEIVTVVTDETTLEQAQRHIGHEDPETTLRWYYKDRLTAKKLEEKRRVAELIAKAIPLRATSRVANDREVKGE